MKIITYTNPFELNNLPIWEDLKKYPHLCVSQTLVEGLKEYYGRDSFTIISTIDSVLSEFYDEWHNNTAKELYQFINLSNLLKSKKECAFKRAFLHNRADVLKAMRFIIEAEINIEHIDDTQMTNEQKYFVDLLKQLQKNECFQGLEAQSNRGKDGLQTSLKKVLEKELNRATKTKEQVEVIYKEVEGNVARLDVKKVYLHGIHQFTPLIIKFIAQLEKADIEVCFLHNYCEEYPGIYQTWDEVYRWTNLYKDQQGTLRNFIPRAVGENIGNIFEGNLSYCKKASEVVNKFTNLTAFADYVSPRYKKAKEKIGTIDQLNMDRLKVIASMEDQFYAVNGEELNEVLKIYFPEHFGGRHFLSYPIGQFILGLYNMWNEKEQAFIINPTDLKECLTINIWKTSSRATPLEMYYDLALYFKKAKTFSDYEECLNQIEYILEKRPDHSQIRKLAFFKYTVDEIREFKAVLVAIKELVEKIFKDPKVQLKEHYTDLMGCILDLSKDSTVSKEEIDFIKNIKDQLDNVQLEAVTANIEDIRSTLHFYLANNKPEEYKAEWIVRDFEQIDGGVLLAKAEQIHSRRDVKSLCYHYGGLSDQSMLSAKRAELPWPLTIDMISDMNRVTRIVSTCKKEYAHFLRYSLFYGTYFLDYNKDIIFSYVEEDQDQKVDLYSILKLMDLQIEDKSEEDLFGEEYILTSFDTLELQHIQQDLTPSEKRSATACYRRFLFNHCLDQDTYFNNEFDLFYISQVFAAGSIVQQGEKGKKEELMLEKFKGIFPFMDTLDYSKIMKMRKPFIGKDSSYMDMRMEFKHAYWTEDDGKSNLLGHIAGVNQVGPYKNNLLKKNLEQFINNDEISYLPTNHNWKVCDVCNQKSVCCYYVVMREKALCEEDY